MFKQLKEITTGTKEQVGLFSLLPVIRDVKIARFVNPLFSPLEKYYNKIFHQEIDDNAQNN